MSLLASPNQRPPTRAFEGTELPALNNLVARYAPRTDLTLVLITHVLPTLKPFLTALAGVCEVEVVAIPYSMDAATADAIRLAGIRVTVPPTIAEIPTAALHAVEAACGRGHLVIVQEIGGYLAACNDRLAEYDNFLGVVEDTNNGHWKYQAIEDTLRFPVVSIARSPIKRIEDCQIGPAVAYSIERVLRECFFTVLMGKQVVVLGFGSIGSSCATALRARGADVGVFDTNPVQQMHARVEGFRVGDFASLVARVDLVVGATGHRSVDESAIGWVKSGAILFSASSKQIEFDVPAFQRYYAMRGVAANVDHYRCPGHDFYLVGEGYPVNFRDFSVIGDVLDGIYSELFVCIREVAERRAKPGLNFSWDQLHQEVAEAWCEAHASILESAT